MAFGAGFSIFRLAAGGGVLGVAVLLALRVLAGGMLRLEGRAKKGK